MQQQATPERKEEVYPTVLFCSILQLQKTVMPLGGWVSEVREAGHSSHSVTGTP